MKNSNTMTFRPFEGLVEGDLIRGLLLPELKLYGISFNFNFAQASIFGRAQVVHTHLMKYCVMMFNYPIITVYQFEAGLAQENWWNLSLGVDLRTLRGLQWHWASLMCA